LDATKASERKSKGWYMGEYESNYGIEDFMAECFQEYRNNSNPSTYAKSIGELIGEYFKIKKY
jgi:hypothetical protein